MPRGFESGLRYLAPALALGLALLPVTSPFRDRLRRLERETAEGVDLGESDVGAEGGAGPGGEPARALRLGRGSALAAAGALALLSAIAIGYPVQRHYLESRYSDPSFTTPGLNVAFKWARSISDARIATTSTRQYPLYGTDLSNRVEYVGIERPHGGFVPPSTCPTWRRLLNAGDYDYVVASRDRIEPGKPPYPATARWTKGSSAKVVLRRPPTIIFRLSGPLDPSACRDLAH